MVVVVYVLKEDTKHFFLMQTAFDDNAFDKGFLGAPLAPDRQNHDLSATGLDLQKLRKLRKGLRLTQADAAALLGIHRTYFLFI